MLVPLALVACMLIALLLACLMWDIGYGHSTTAGGARRRDQSETGVILLVPIFWSVCNEHQQESIDLHPTTSIKKLNQKVVQMKCVLAFVLHLEFFETWNVNSICRMTYLTGHFMSHWTPNVFWIQRAKVFECKSRWNCLEGQVTCHSGRSGLDGRTGVSQQKEKANRIKLNFVKENHPVLEHVLLAFFRDMHCIITSVCNVSACRYISCAGYISPFLSIKYPPSQDMCIYVIGAGSNETKRYSAGTRTIQEPMGLKPEAPTHIW